MIQLLKYNKIDKKIHVSLVDASDYIYDILGDTFSEDKIDSMSTEEIIDHIVEKERSMEVTTHLVGIFSLELDIAYYDPEYIVNNH